MPAGPSAHHEDVRRYDHRNPGLEGRTTTTGRVGEDGFECSFCIISCLLEAARRSAGRAVTGPGPGSGPGQNTSGGFHLSTRRSTRLTMANAATAIPAPRTTVAYSNGARKL